MGPKDTAYCARIALDTPIDYHGHKITHVYYAHMSALEFVQHEGAASKRHVDAGEKLGTSGIANGSWHLHLGLLLDDQGGARRLDLHPQGVGGPRRARRIPATWAEDLSWTHLLKVESLVARGSHPRASTYTFSGEAVRGAAERGKRPPPLVPSLFLRHRDHRPRQLLELRQ